MPKGPLELNSITPIRSYQNYREFLKAFVNKAKQNNPRWSYGVWAKKLGLKSKSSLIMTVQGKRKMSPKLMNKMIQYFQFNSDEESYFRRLISIESKERTIVHQVEANITEDTKTLPTSQSEAVVLRQGWLSYVIKEAAVSLGKSLSLKRLAQSITTHPSEHEVNNILSALVKSGYLVEQKSGESTYYESAKQSPKLNWDRDSIGKLHLDGLRACEKASQDVPPNGRIFQTSFVRIRKERLEEARIILRSFQKEFTREMEEETGNEVVQLNLHLFPATIGLKD